MGYYAYRGSRSSSVAGRRKQQQNRRKPQGRGQYINPSRFVRAARPNEVEEYQATHQFSDFAMHPKLLTNLSAKGYVTPSPIQDQTIPLGLDGQDVIGIANTGTGKTAAFAVPVLTRLMNDRDSRALIVAPTRELAEQIQDECRSIARGSGLFGALLIGGSSMGKQLTDLKHRPRIVIGTPGRIKDHLERGTLQLERFNMVVLDEVDRMLDMGFLPDMTDILKQLAGERQSFFFSATMDTRVRNLIATFSQNPVTVSVKTSDTSDNVHQDVVHYTGNSDKMDKLHTILNDESVEKVIIFDETQRGVERLGNELMERGFKADAIHGGKTQGQRQRALRRFKKSEVNILVATDVAARGIDVADITHVVNYGLPQTYEDYTHRVGRAGRAGRIGFALTFVSKY
ncbi:DEAD/DEAH box helicase [Candidatus Saccharibacteria bacterium]|nr:DEAD/DEAH box helicase [Candidatus Saccharibacteria bacterium]